MKEESAPDFYLNFKPHVDRISNDHPVFDKLTSGKPITDEEVENCQTMADFIGRQLLHRDEETNECWWWRHKDFAVLDKKGKVKGYKHPLIIEKLILLEHKRDNWGYKTKYGTDPYVHCLNIISMLFPLTDITPPLADITELMCAGFTYGRRRLHLIGS